MAALLPALGLTFGAPVLSWLLNRGTNETVSNAMDAQQALALMQAQILQNRAQTEEPYRQGLLNSLGGFIDQPRSYAIPGQMSVVNPFLNLNRAKRDPKTGRVSYERAVKGDRQFIGPQNFETKQTSPLGIAEAMSKATDYADIDTGPGTMADRTRETDVVYDDEGNPVVRPGGRRYR